MIKKEEKERNLFLDQFSDTGWDPPRAEIPSSILASPALSSMSPTWRPVIPLQIQNWNRNELQCISNAESPILSVSPSFPTLPKKDIKIVHIRIPQSFFYWNKKIAQRRVNI